ncbi:TPA: hypothetical protein MIM70_31110 [Klebsiella variicola]|nr:hypothetical protein [Klebsiella variicola]
MFELLAEDVYVTMISVKPVAKNLCLLYATITVYRLCPNRGRSIVCDIGLWLIRAGGYLFVSTVCDGQLKWICASGRTVYCIRRAVKWPIISGYAGYEQLVSTVYAKPRTGRC